MNVRSREARPSLSEPAVPRRDGRDRDARRRRGSFTAVTIDAFRAVADYGAEFLASLSDRDVAARATRDELVAALGGPLPEDGVGTPEVVRDLVAAAEPGIVGMQSGRFFGFVIGGSHPAAIAADWLTSVWDQNAGLYAASPSAVVVEDVAREWLRELLGLPAGVSCGFVTGCQMAHVTCLAAARHHVLAEAGWDVERDGLAGSPPMRVLIGEEAHVTVQRALRLLGVGASSLVRVRVDGDGRMHVPALEDALASASRPTIVCAQVGDVNTGAVDPVGAIVPLAREHGAWVHVDGAFGLWAAASDRLRPLVAGVEQADSWATDGHKWLNVPYDSGYAFCAHSQAHRAAMQVRASYLVKSDAEAGAPSDPMDWTPEFSRRARGFPTYAAIRALGRTGVAELVERCCDHARLFAELLADAPGVEVLNEVVLNQVLVRFDDDDARTEETVRRVQEDGTCWLAGTRRQGRSAMRISVSNWRTTEADVRLSVEAILRAAREPAPA
jgi:glutamate/tyrosine decarboxylase-like PLP-dependent enzyme